MSSANSSPPAGAALRAIPFNEFVALIAALMACQALAIDTMLPALPVIGNALGVASANRTQWIITSYIVGLGAGQFFWGMLADRFGRRPTLLVGIALYLLAALACGISRSFPMLLALRFVHGLAAASIVVARSIIRDLYEGRQMARILSLTFIVFMIAPILAPSLGQLILLWWSWRWLFAAFGVFAAIVWIWMLLRLPETLHPEYRIRLQVGTVLASAARVLTDRASICYTLAVAVAFGSVIAYVGMAQQIFTDVFHRAALMPAMFALCASAMAAAAYLNSRVVVRVGMRKVSQLALLGFIAVTALHSALAWMGMETLPSFVLLQAATLAGVGLTAGNFGSMAMEPMGDIAGIAAAVQGSVSTVGGGIVGALIGRGYHGTTLTLASGGLACGLVALSLVLVAERGKLFRPHHATADPAAAPPPLH